MGRGRRTQNERTGLFIFIIILFCLGGRGLAPSTQPTSFLAFKGRLRASERGNPPSETPSSPHPVYFIFLLKLLLQRDNSGKEERRRQMARRGQRTAEERPSAEVARRLARQGKTRRGGSRALPFPLPGLRTPNSWNRGFPQCLKVLWIGA